MNPFFPISTDTPAQLAKAGLAFVIRCVPDPFTAERINIGVCVVRPDGKRLVKVIQEPGRLDCLYGEKAYMVVNLARMAEACLLEGEPPPSSQIQLDEPEPFYNMTPEDMLAATFADQVTVALPRRQDLKRAKIDDESALRMVTDQIKTIKGLEAQVVASNPYVQVETERGHRAIHIPLQPRRGAGTIRSGDYSFQSLRMHLMDSLIDLECAARHSKLSHLGMFILRPAYASEAQKLQTDNAIDDVYVRAPRSLHLSVSEDSKDLAQEINEWAEMAA